MTHNPIKPFLDKIPPEFRPMFEALMIEQQNTREMICKKVEDKVDEIKLHCANQSSACNRKFLPKIQAYVLAGVIIGLLVGLGILQIDAVAGLLK
jgi:hypothetical protein